MSPEEMFKDISKRLMVMDERQREDNNRLHERLDEYNRCNQENSRCLATQSTKIKGLQKDMEEIRPLAQQVPSLNKDIEAMKPYIQDQKESEAGKKMIRKWVNRSLAAATTLGSFYALYLKFFKGIG